MTDDYDRLKKLKNDMMERSSRRRTREKNEHPDYYVLTPVYPPEAGEFHIANASVGTCQLCGGIATGMGGSDKDICIKCAEVVMSGKARGAIVWGEGDA